MANFVHAHLQRGAVADALREADVLLARGDLREALAAYGMLAQALPDRRAHCISVVGDIHAQLGEPEQARAAYGHARAMGASAQWVDARLAWLSGTRPSISSMPPPPVPSMPPPMPADASETWIIPGGREVTWASNQKGVVVIRPSYVAFLPTDRATHIASILTKVVASAATGAVWARFGRPRDQQTFAAQLRMIPIGELDAMMEHAAADLGGVMYRHGQARYHADELPLGWRLYFQVNGSTERLLLTKAKESMRTPLFQRLSQHWMR